ncbi:sigma-70 family RNA polymerase sigma factor [Nonomuraea sp. NPDC005692]|uniref:RNA polymerase sigma factor n=1 Tax=Nonomuraea sp. NPDC005692 TaxID=3157168 RepID=UPI0033D09C89
MEALKLLHQRHAPWLRVRLARRCADFDLVDDAIQDTFVAVWRDAHRYRAPEGEAAAWIWTIAIRRLISALRRSGAAPPVAALDGSHATGGHRSAAHLISAHLVTESAEDAVLVGVEHGDLGAALARAVTGAGSCPSCSSTGPTGRSAHRRCTPSISSLPSLFSRLWPCCGTGPGRCAWSRPWPPRRWRYPRGPP